MTARKRTPPKVVIDGVPQIVVDQIELVAVGDLVEHPDNPRTHATAELRAMIRAHGFNTVLGAQRSTRRIVYGHGRLEAAKAEGMTHVPVVWLDITDAQAREQLLGDNRAADLAGYDTQRLADLLAEVAPTSDTAVLDRIGFSAGDIEDLLAQLAPSEEPETVDPPIMVPENPVTVAGDVWILGDHRVKCGDCRNPDDVSDLLDGAQVHLGFASPPYADRRKYDETTIFRPIPPSEYVEWFAPVAANVAANLTDDGSWFVNIKAGADGLDSDLYVLDLVLAHAREWGWHYVTELCWQRNGVPKSVTRRFKNQFEPIHHFARGEFKMRAEHVMHHSENAVTPFGPGAGDTGWQSDHGAGSLGAGGRVARTGTASKRQGRGGIDGDALGATKRKSGTRSTMSDVQGINHDVGEYIGPGMAYPGNRLPTYAGSHEATGHAAAFPVGLPQFFVEAYTDEGDTVYDPFVGSGSTVLAAQATARRAFGMELSPAYVDVTCRRFQAVTGIEPVLARTNQAHSFT